MNIKEERKRLGLKQYQMARVVGLAKENYNKMEKGKFPMPEYRYNLICDFLRDYSKIYELIERLIKSYENKSIDIKEK